jgi:putative hydrolase of the HAD superfamily
MTPLKINPKPAFIVLDLDNTLYEYENAHKIANESLVKYLSNTLSLHEDFVLSGLSEARMSVKDRLGESASSHSRILYINEYLNQNQITTSADVIAIGENVYWNEFFGVATLREHAESFLQIANNFAVPIYLITDLTLQIQIEKLNHFGITQFIHRILSSEDAGGDKITDKPFNLLRSYIQYSGEHFWAIGDNCWDFPNLDGFKGRDFSVTSLSCDHIHEVVDFNELCKKLKNVCEPKAQV